MNLNSNKNRLSSQSCCQYIDSTTNLKLLTLTTNVRNVGKNRTDVFKLFISHLKHLDIKKHTERENSEHPDVKGIESCLDALKDVMAHINEDKRKTESQRQIFDIVYEVEGCPPTLVSSHR